jgi:Protein of unknown function (DUF574).
MVLLRRFLDIGSGLPTQQNVHEVAQAITPDARVVYVDNDPLVRVHADVLLAGDGNTAVIEGDLRDPQAILGNPTLTGLVDFARPVGLLMVAVLHFIEDLDEARASVRALCDRLPSGSYLVLSHACPLHESDAENVRNVYQRSNSPVILRTADQIGRFFDGLTLVGPGLVPIADWKLDGDDQAHPDDKVVPITDRAVLATVGIMCGIGRIDR